jgi:hypothetical protein
VLPRWFGVVALVLGACPHDAPPPVAPPPPIRDAVGDAELREMLADVASARACERIRDHFHALRDGNRHDVVLGDLWIHGCTGTHVGTKLTFTVTGGGWQWEDKTTREVGAGFAVRQYIRFTATATLTGTLDLGYDPTSHVGSLWFSPDGEPTVNVDPVGNIAVRNTSTWSSVVAAVGKAFSRSPAQAGVTEAKKQAQRQFLAQLVEGLTVTVDLCSGIIRSTSGRLPRGVMAPPDVLEPSSTALELEPGGLLVLGPQRAKSGMSVHVDARGPVDVALACYDQAAAAARAYLEGDPPPAIDTLAQASGPGSADLAVPAETCPVAVIARSPVATPTAEPAKTVEFTVQRSSAEIGFANGGPLAACSN